MPRRRGSAQWWFFGQFCQILSARDPANPSPRVEMLPHCPRGTRRCLHGTTGASRSYRTPKDDHPMNKLLSSLGVAIAVATVSLLAGCQLYFGSSGSSGGTASGGGGGSSDGNGNPPGAQCSMDSSCAAGCFCANGVCTEGGFCATDKDCGGGFHCDTARSSCIPNAGCTTDAQCKQGAMCDIKSGACQATCLCTSDADAIKAGFAWCDEARNTCMSGSDPAGMCLGTVSCTGPAPVCPDNQVALVKDGCFTGQCRAIAACEGAPVCAALQHQDDCTTRSTDCTSIFIGRNCKGSTCGTTNTDCVCDRYDWAACDVVGAPVTIIPGN
jgi:hypothetical protein